MKKKLLSVILAFCMVVAYMPVLSFADVDAGSVAKIGDTGYPTLEEAIAAAQDNDTIELLDNIELDAVVTISKPLTIDFGTYKINSTVDVNDSTDDPDSAFAVSAASLGLKNATLETRSKAFRFTSNSAVLNISGKNTIDVDPSYGAKGGIYANEKLRICGSDAMKDSLEISIPGKNSFVVMGDTFTADKVTISMDSGIGIYLPYSYELDKVEIKNSKLIGVSTYKLIQCLAQENGCDIEFDIEGSVLQGHGAIITNATSDESPGDIAVNFRNSTVDLTIDKAPAGEEKAKAVDGIKLYTLAGNATLTIDNSKISVTQGNCDKNMPINVGTGDEVDGHGLSKAVIKNKSEINLTGGAIGLNIWTWGENNTLGTVLDIDDSKITVKDGTLENMDAYAYGDAATTYVTIDNSTLDLSGSPYGFVLGLDDEYKDNADSVDFKIKDSKMSVRTKGEAGRTYSTCAFYAYGTVYNIKYSQVDSDVDLSGDYAMLVELGSGDGTLQESTVSVSGGSLKADGMISVEGKKTAEVTLDTDADFSKTGMFKCNKLNIADGKYILNGEKNRFTCANGNITGGVFSERPDGSLIAEGYALVSNDDPQTMNKYPIKVAVPGAETNIAEVAEAEPEVHDPAVSTTATKPGSTQTYSPEEVDAAQAATTAISSNASKLSITGTGIDAEATKIAENNTVTGDDSSYKNEENQTVNKSVLEAVNDAPGNAANPADTADDIAIMVLTYTDIQVADISISSGDSGQIQSITYEIRAMAQKVATTEDVADSAKDDPSKISVEGADQNAIKLGAPEELEVDKVVEITIPLPAEFYGDTENAGNVEVFIQHKGHEYKAELVKSDGTYFATFSNPDGFSPFILSKSSQTVAKIGERSFTSLEAALGEAGDDDVITITGDCSGDTVELEGNGSIKLRNEGGQLPKIVAPEGFEVAQSGPDGDGVVTYLAIKSTQTPNDDVQKTSIFDKIISFSLIKIVLSSQASLWGGKGLLSWLNPIFNLFSRFGHWGLFRW